MLRTVIRIDPHVLRREITGEKLQRGAARAQRNADLIDRFRHIRMRAIMVERAGGPVAADLLFTQIDVDALRIDLDSGTANRGQNASPVWISTRPGRLNQRRIGDGAADLPRLTP